MTSSLEKFLNDIQKLIAEDEIQQALDQLQNYLSTADSELNNEIILHVSRYNRLCEEKRKGLISRQEFQVDLSRLSDNLLEFLKEIPKKIQRESSSTQLVAFQSDRNNSRPEVEIFISYAWGGESEKLVDQLDQTLQKKGILIIRDKRDLGFKGRIREFMERIGRGRCVIVVISEKYLKSENCMFELLRIAENGDFYDRIFPIVLEDAGIYKPVERIKYIRHWEKQAKELDEAMKGVSSANLQGFREDIDLYTKIRHTIAKLTDILKDMNTLTPEIHSESGFDELIRTIERKIAE
ncbi:TIR domain-containing protein [Desulfobacterales bacterium HSG2]|nr:TIR domain-containing protein [Desulfobacterales bacterium HSG2]